MNTLIDGAQRASHLPPLHIHTVDRFDVTLEEQIVTLHQQKDFDVSSGTSPYTEGFRKSLKVTNGNQSSVDATDNIIIRYQMQHKIL